MNVFEHRGTYNANKPVLIYQRGYDGNGGRRIAGVCKDNEAILSVGDVIVSNYIGSTATESLPCKLWEVQSIEERSTPPGHFIIDISDGGFVAIVRPASDETMKRIDELGVRI